MTFLGSKAATNVTLRGILRRSFKRPCWILRGGGKWQEEKGQSSLVSSTQQASTSTSCPSTSTELILSTSH